MRRLLAVLVVACATTASCGSPGTDPPPATPTAADTPVRTVRLPSPCTYNGVRLQVVRKRLMTFVQALQQGDGEQASRMFPDDFEWFSLTGSPAEDHPDHFVLGDRQAVSRFVGSHDEFAFLLDAVEVDERPQHGHIDVRYTGRWITPDLPLEGKGAIECRTGKILVWSMAVRKEPSEVKYCSDERRRPGGTAAPIVCE